MVLYLTLVTAAVVFAASVLYLVHTRPRPRRAPAAKPPLTGPRIAPVPIVTAPLEPSAEDEITVVAVQLDVPELDEDEQRDIESAVARAVPIVADSGADQDEPTRTSAAILVSAAAQSDRGQRRKRNEDRLLRLDSHGVYAVADGMGGHVGGAIASETAVETIAAAFRARSFEGRVRGELPRRATELAQAVQMANLAILRRALEEPHLTGMGTTMVATRFSLRKERLYLAHVGDSRCYRIRGGAIRQLTTDHTMRELGLTGPHADHLSRALGVKPEVTIDLLIARPELGDLYLLCSDGLTRMVPDDGEICATILEGEHDLDLAVQRLVDLANRRGGRDNITVVLVGVRHPSELQPND